MAENDKPGSAQKWANSLEFAKREFKDWENRGVKIVKRYRDERESMFTMEKKYNILWSNIRTLLPAVYAKKPKSQVERRFKDNDPVARCASQILERALQFEIDHYSDYDNALRSSILDRLLPGRGVAWVRYEPHYIGGMGNPETDDGLQVTEVVENEEAEDRQVVDYECSPTDYVYWKDFRCSPARTWEEVTWVARRVYMTKDEGIERFGEDFARIPMTHEPIGIKEMKDAGIDVTELKKGVVWEIWDKPTGKAIWIAEGWPEILDEQDDPLELEGFFPCPKPLFATLTTDSVVPVPDYYQYQDQADELDQVTNRIAKLTEACKVVGVYDASQTGIQRMLQEGVDNVMIPVDTWAAFAERGGVKGAVDFMPLADVIGALQQLYASREQIKQVIYEVTGLSDIIRGASVATETATAQQIKSQYASLRLKEMQGDVARFASDLLRIKAQIMCQFYKPETLIQMSGMASSLDAQYIPQALQLLKDQPARNFRIEVATDSLVELDEAGEKQSRLEFMQAASQFLQQAVPAAQSAPELAPLLGEMLMFGVRSFKSGRPLEAAFEEVVQAFQQKPQGQEKPDPEMEKVKAQQQADQARLQADMQRDQAKAQADMQIEQMKAQMHVQIEQMRLQAQQQLEQMRLAAQMEFDRWKAELDAATKLEAANISAREKVANPATAAATQEIAREIQ